MSETGTAVVAPKITKQLINVMHHNKAMYHEKWFGKGQCILLVEKVRAPDGRCVKRVITVKDPTVRYYVTAPEFQAEHKLPELSYPIEQCDQYESPVENLYQHIAELSGQMAFFNESRGPGANRRRRKLHDHRWLHGSDANLVDHYIDRYMETNKACLDTATPIDMAFADIEVDIIDHTGFPDEHSAPCPINLISYFRPGTKKLIQFILRNGVRENPQIAEFEADIDNCRNRLLCEMNRAILEKPRKSENGEKLQPLIAKDCEWEIIAASIGLVPDIPADEDCLKVLRCTEVDLRVFDTELELIKAFLHQVNEVDRPDVLAYWNMRFDIMTQLNRLQQNGVDPESAFTPNDFKPWALADYSEDAYNTEPTECGDYFNCTSYTIYVDQMLLYAQLRKTSGKKESYSLDYTLRNELGESKYEYEGSIRDLAYRDFMSFLIYGGIDVVPMAALEARTEDIALAYQLSMMTRTRFHKIMKKTICLRNLAEIFYRERGLALSNNRNRNKERTDSAKFRGAFVASPKLMGYTGITLAGSRSNRIFDNVVDFDATSLYPSIITATNIDAAGQVGRLVIPSLDGGDLDTSLLMESLAAGDIVEVGRDWLGLPGLDELANLVLES
jgi:hypothetical protein